MSKPRLVPLAFAALLAFAAFACTDVSGSSTSVLSIQFDSLGAPSVVVGDTLRDTTGAVIVPVVHAFSFNGEEIIPAPVWFQSPDSGVAVDSVTGIVVGDSLFSTPVRIVATVGTLQAIQRLDLTLRPDLLAPLHDRDSLAYLVNDTTSNVLTVKLTHGVAPNDSVVKSYIVSFAIVSQSAPDLATLVNERGLPSVVDTTSADGVAGRAIRLHPLSVTSAVDSIIVNATARYRGVEVIGSPVRLVMKIQPRS
jgi:hypothetical protein